MKLKTSLLFWQNQFYKILFLIGIFIGLGSFATKAFSASSSESDPGIVESLERLLVIHKKQFDQSKTTSQSSVKAITDFSNLKNIKFDSQFMRSILFHSEDRFLRLTQKDECKFLSAIENNLLKTVDGDITNVLINYQNTEGKTESAAIARDLFFEQIYKKKCLNNKEFGTLFNETNLQKTIQGIKFSVPKNTTECDVIHKEWLDNSFTPYLCKISQILKKSKSQKQIDLYKDKIPNFQRNYIENLCANITSPELFCSSYLKKDSWNKVLNGEAPLYKMSFKCQNIMGKTEDLSPEDLKNCAAKLLSDPAICETRGNKNFPSDFPLQNCDIQSVALSKSRLVTNYHDCPGNIDNEAITNIHRLVNHFAPRNIVTTKETCGGEANYTFARLNLDINHQDGWPLKVCFKNNIVNKEECIPYIPGSRSDETLSEDQVIAKILYQHKGAPIKTKCRIVDSKTYSPVRSEFKFGCFIVYDVDNCTTINCSKKVIWEEKLQSDIKFIGNPIFDYFPTSFANERYSFANMINEVKGTQSRSIKNLTDVKFFLDNIPTGVIHGVGCLEDLTPEEFQRTAMNQCHPMPFIIDGYTIKNTQTWLVFRSAIDDLHSPRLILWPNIFNAVSAHRELHPLNTWTLYGIKK